MTREQIEQCRQAWKLHNPAFIKPTIDYLGWITAWQACLASQPATAELVEALKECVNALEDYIDQLEKAGGIMNYGRHVLTLSYAALASASKPSAVEQPVCRWVSCRERLPKTSNKYAVLQGVIGVTDLVLNSAFFHEHGQTWSKGPDQVFNITHWLDGVPPTPKEEE